MKEVNKKDGHACIIPDADADVDAYMKVNNFNIMYYTVF